MAWFPNPQNKMILQDKISQLPADKIVQLISNPNLHPDVMDAIKDLGFKVSPQPEQAAPASPVTQNKNFGVGGRVKKNGVAAIIQDDYANPKIYEDEEPVGGLGGGYAALSGSTGGFRDKLLGKDVEEKKKFLGELGFEDPSAGKMKGKLPGLLDSIFSGLASVGSAAVGDRENAIGIRQGLAQRQGARQSKKSAFQNALLSLVTKDPRPNIVKEFEAFSAMDPVQQAKMEEYLRIKGNADPLKATLSRMFGG